MPLAIGDLSAETTGKMSEAERERLWRLVEPVYRDLARIAAAILRFVESEDGEDAVQESFVSFAKLARCGKLHCLDNRCVSDINDCEIEQYVPRCRAYLVTVLIRHCCCFRRKARSRARVRTEWATKATKVTGHIVSELVLQEEMTWMRSAVAQLPDQLRVVAALRFYGRCSVQETAAALGIPEGTVKSRTYQIRKRLKALVPLEFIDR